jgi:hypothetical protein
MGISTMRFTTRHSTLVSDILAAIHEIPEIKGKYLKFVKLGYVPQLTLTVFHR